MKNILNRTFTALAAAAMLLAVSCSKPAPETIQYLEVNASNLHGDWELVSIKDQPLEEGASFRINFNRSGEEFKIWNAMNSIPSSYDYSEGTFKIYNDRPELGPYIRGIDNAGEEWGDLYVIKELTRTDMTWVGVNDPTFVQTFSRIQK